MSNETDVAEEDLEEDWVEPLRPVGDIIQELTAHFNALAHLAHDVRAWSEEFEERAYKEDFDQQHCMIRSAAWGYVSDILDGLSLAQSGMLGALHMDRHPAAEAILTHVLGEGFIERNRSHWLDAEHNGKHDA